MALGLAAICATSAWAVDGTWNGTTNNLWSTVTNWSSNPNPVPGTGNIATFSNAGNGFTTLDLGAGVTILTMNFSNAPAAGYTIGSGGAGAQTLTLNTNSAVTINNAVLNHQLFNANLVLGTVAGAQNFTFTNSRPTLNTTLTLAGGISSTTTGIKTLTITGSGDTLISGAMTNGTGTLALSKTGAGVLTLSNTGNNYSSGTSVTAGFLRSGADNVLSDAGAVSVGGTGTLDLAGFNDTVSAIAFGVNAVGQTAAITTGAGTLNLTGNISQDSNGFGTKIISGNLSLGGGTRTISNAGANNPLTITADISNGGLINTQGRVILSGTNTFAGGATATSGTIEVGVDSVGSVGAITSSAIGTGTLTFNGGGLSSDGTTARTILNAVTFTGNASLGNATRNGALTFSADVNLGNANRAVNVAAGTTVEFNGILSGAGGGITNSGAGTLILNNAGNSFTGGGGLRDTSTSTAVFRWGASDVFANTGALSTGGAGTIDLAGFSDTVASIFLGVNAAGQTSSITTGGGTLTINGNITTDSNAFGNQLISGNLNLGGAVRNVSIGVGSNLAKQLAISANVSNGGINYSGTNTTLLLSGTNNYAGGTTVGANGTLIFANTSAKPASGTTTVAAAATLGLGVGGAGFFGSADVGNLFAGTLTNVSNNATSIVGIDTTAGDFSYASNVAATTRGLTKLGANKLTMSGNNAFTGAILIRQGTLELTGDNSLATGATTVSSGTTLSFGAANNLAAGALTVSGGTLQYTGGTATINRTFAITTNTTATVEVMSSVANLSLTGVTGAATNGSLTKTGLGTLTLTGKQTYTGATTLVDGTLVLGGGDHTLAANKALVVNGGTLDLGTTKQYAGALSGSGGSITGNGGSLTIQQANASSTFAGSIDGSLNLTVVRSNQNNSGGQLNFNLTNNSTTTGTLTLIGGDNPHGQPGGGSDQGTFHGISLKDNGILNAVSAIQLNNGTLYINNAASSQALNGGTAETSSQYLADRVNDAATITLNGGRIQFLGRASTVSTETLGAVIAASGMSTIHATPGGTGTNNAELTLTSLTRANGAVLMLDSAVTGTLGTAGNSNGRIFVNDPLTGNLTAVGSGVGVIPGLFRGTRGSGNLRPVGYVAGQGFVPVGNVGGPAQYTGALNLAPTDANVMNPSALVVATGGQTINSLLQNGNITFAAASDRLTVASGMLLQTGEPKDIGTALVRGELTSGLSTGELFLIKDTGAATGGGTPGDNEVYAVITDNGATRVQLVIVNYNRENLTKNNFNLRAANTHTGGTVYSGGNTLLLTGPSELGGAAPIAAAFDPAKGLVINNSTVTMQTNAQQIAASNIVTLNGGSALNLVGANVLAGIVFNSNGGKGAAPTVAGSGVNLSITGDIVSNPTNPSTTPIISVTTLNLIGGNNITVSALPQGNFVNTLTPLNGLTISSVIASGSFTKKGNGVLQLTGNSSFSGQLTIEEGVINVATVNNNNVAGPLGMNGPSIIMGGSGGKIGTLEYTGGTAPSSRGFTMASGGDGAFQIDAVGTNLTLNGPIDGDGGLIKTGAGKLILSGSLGTPSYQGDTEVTAGVLQISQTYLNDTSNVFLSTGSILQLTAGAGNADTIGALVIDGVSQAIGTWGATGSGAQFINDTVFTGNSMLNVTSILTVPEPASISLLVLGALAFSGRAFRRRRK